VAGALLARDGQDPRRHWALPGGEPLGPDEALRLFTVGSSWFSSEEGRKGAIVPSQLADLAVLSADYFAIPDEEIKRLESVLTVVGGTVVYGAGAFARLSPPPLPVSPDWSPVAVYGGYGRAAARGQMYQRTHAHGSVSSGQMQTWGQGMSGLWSLGCQCFAF
jgi:hypothetical protein